MDQKKVTDKKDKSNQPADAQTKATPANFQPLTPSLTKEQEKVASIEKQVEKIVEGKEIPELGPEYREIELPDKIVPTLPSEMVKTGVTPVLPPTLPWDLQPVAQTITLPLTKTRSKTGKALPVVTSLRWLTEWCLRLIKITEGKIKYVFKSQNNHGT